MSTHILTAEEIQILEEAHREESEEEFEKMIGLFLEQQEDEEDFITYDQEGEILYIWF